MAGLLILFTVLKKRGFSLFLQLATLLFENDEELKFLFALWLNFSIVPFLVPITENFYQHDHVVEMPGED